MTTAPAAPSSVAAGQDEWSLTHMAVCRYRQQGLICSLCQRAAERGGAGARG